MVRLGWTSEVVKKLWGEGDRMTKCKEIGRVGEGRKQGRRSRKNRKACEKGKL
jgi:hypothetical protein